MAEQQLQSWDDLFLQTSEQWSARLKASTERPNWDQFFVQMSRLCATRSKDPNTQIGAVIVGPDNEVISTGYNNMPRKVDDNVPERNSRENGEKYFWYEHAERNAIYQAARHGGALKECRIYISYWMSCADCARAIIQVGIEEVIFGQRVDAVSQKKWKEQALRSDIMFKEAGVKVRYYAD